MRAPILLGLATRMYPKDEMQFAVPVDIGGLRQVISSSLYPLDTSNLVLALAYPPESPPTGTIHFYFTNEGHVGQLDVTTEQHGQEPWKHQQVVGFCLRGDRGLTLVRDPGELTLTFQGPGSTEETPMGAICFKYRKAPALTAEQIQAIEADPSARKVIRHRFFCNNCPAVLTAVASTSRAQADQTLKDIDKSENLVWYQDLPDRFECACGDTSMPLCYSRESMHGMLLYPELILPDGSLNFNTEIKVRDVEIVLSSFRQLIDADPKEEEVQRFITDHPLLLSPFGPRRIFFKPPILNLCKADFGILNARNELLLIEIERPSMGLMRKTGERTHELTHAIKQTHDWDAEIEQSRDTVLRCIEGCPRDIVRVNYLVIAGRSGPYDAEQMRKLLRSCRNPDLMTYDQLIDSVRNIARSAAV